MKGDRVKIGQQGFFNNPESVVPVYMPRLDGNGQFITDNRKNVSVEMQGGVKAGTTGVIHGDPVRVLRSQLYGSEAPVGTVGDDSTLLYPIALDTYQRVGWFPAEHMMIVSGGI